MLYKAELNRCQCHPETCCCKDYKVEGPEGKVTFYDKPQAEHYARMLNENAALKAQLAELEEIRRKMNEKG